MAWTRTAAQLLPVIVCLAAPAHAEGERAASVGVGWATFSAPAEMKMNMEPTSTSPDVGASLGFTYEHSLGSDFSLRGELAGSLFYGGNAADQSKVSYGVVGDVGATFRFDVLKYVPYAFGGVGGEYTGGGPIDRGIQPVLVLGGGLDVLLSRDRSWGVEGRLVAFGSDVTVFTLGLRGTARWGYF